jgi:pimeloyl-ACP methyl ester carboxylesterase
MARRVVPPLRPGWVIVDGRPMFHRWCRDAPDENGAIVHVHGFGISGTYLEPSAALLAARHPTFVPDLPGMGRSLRPERPLDLPGLARALDAYCDAVGVERATFVGNSLGCPIIVELASTFPERIDRVVLISPAGGPNNLPLRRALGQMARDTYREPPSMVPIAARDYLRFGVLRSWLLFRAMNSYDTLGGLTNLVMPTLVVAGDRDPLVRIDRVGVFAGLPHVEAVKIAGAHALNFSRPEVVAALVEGHIAGRPLSDHTGPGSTVDLIPIGAPPPDARAEGDPTVVRGRRASPWRGRAPRR